ncbi:adhesive plaque matrix protein-like isoform X2 [Eriocheir sinensis]|nr:adhesive plaque matrix protein-like isoform X2 [Eriocheir sinensis]
MVSRGVIVAAAALMVCVVAPVTAEPGFFKGGCRPKVQHVPHYTTLYQKVPVVHNVYREKIVPAPIYQTEYKTVYHTQYHTQIVPKYVTSTLYNTRVEYVPEYTTQYHTEYQPKYVTSTQYEPKYIAKTQYETKYHTKTKYKTVFTTQYHPQYVTKKDVRFETQYNTQYVPQYHTVTTTDYTYKTACPESSYSGY